MEWDSTLLNEDDSLLQRTPTRIGNRISPMKYSRIPEDSVKDDCSSSKDTSNKENISINKSEGPKLNMEPVQMKKKRKGAGYNLRKSLAWDRAFFTEEGVLDPLELSMISGTHVNPSREGLSTINEDDSLSNDCQSNNDTDDLQALEKNLFKEVPAASLKKNIGPVRLPPKQNSPAHGHGTSTSAASLKVLPTRGASKTGSSARGCSRPLPLSLKRSTNINAGQSVTKESKLPRIPVSMPGHSSTLVTKKSVTQGASHAKRKQITQPVANIQNQRNVALKSSPKSVKDNQNKPKAGPGSLPVKPSVSRSKRNVINSPIYPNSSAQSNPPVGNKVSNTDLKVIPDDAGPSIAVPLSDCQDGSTKIPASLLRETSITSSTKQHKLFPSMKPSGLRMPSPSLGFFGQPKSSVSHCASKRAVEADNPGSRKPGYLRPPHTPVKISEVANDIKQTIDTVVLRSGSDFQALSRERMKQNEGEDAVRQNLKFSNEDGPSEVNDRSTISVNSDSNILGCRESRLSTCSEPENFLLLPQQKTVKYAKVVPIPRNSIENSLSCLQDLHDVSKGHGETLDSSSGEAITVPRGDEHLLGEKCSYSKDSQNLSSKNLENADLITPACMEIERKSSGSSSQERCGNLEKSLILDDVNLQSHNGETELQMTKIISTCKNNLNDCSEFGDLNSFTGKSLELQSAYLLQNPQNNHVLSAADCELVEEHTQEVTENLPLTMLHLTCQSELDSCGEVAQVPVGMQNECFDISKLVGEALVEESVHTSSEIASSAENHNCSVTTNVDSYVICGCEVTSSDSLSALNEASKSLVMDECGTFNGNNVQNRQVNENDIMVERPGNLTLFSPCLDSEIVDVSHGSLLAENRFHGEDQNCDHQNIPEADSTVYYSSRIPLEKSNVSQVANASQIDEHEKEVTSSSNILQVEDEVVQETDCNVPVECCINHMQVVSDQFMAVVPIEKSGEVGLPNISILAEKVPQIDKSLRPDDSLSRETTASAEFEEKNAFEREVDARGCALESFRPVAGAPLPMNVGDDGDKFKGASYVVHTTPGCEEVEPSSENYTPFTGRGMKHDMENRDLTSSRDRNQGVSISKKSNLLDETKAKVAQDIDSLAEGSYGELDGALCLAKDKDTTAPIKISESSSSRKSVAIIPPTNAVPFSDEWLTAMEAAGEDILKMKSGAVQNSPTDKSLPELGPWSPVRRKNNAIGPFDCTKFTNN